MIDILEKKGEKIFVVEDTAIKNELASLQSNGRIEEAVRKQMEGNPRLRGNILISIPPKEMSGDLQTLAEEVAMMEQTRQKIAEFFERAGVNVIMAKAPFDGTTYKSDSREYAWPWMQLHLQDPLMRIKVKALGKGDEIKIPKIYDNLDPKTKVSAPMYNKKIMSYKHPNIVPETIIHTDNHDIVTISRFLENSFPLSYIAFVSLRVWQALKVCKQIASALDYLHSMKIAHGDLKPENVLLRLTDNAHDIESYVMDFEYSRPYTESDCYRTPEFSEMNFWDYYEDPSVDDRSDIFALGLIMIEIFGGSRNRLERKMAECKTVFEKRDCFYSYLETLPIPGAKLRDEIIMLIRRMIRYSREERISAGDAMMKLADLMELYKEEEKHPTPAAGKNKPTPVKSGGISATEAKEWGFAVGVAIITAALATYYVFEQRKEERAFCSWLGDESAKVDKFEVPSGLKTVNDVVEICRNEYGYYTYDAAGVSKGLIRLSKGTSVKVSDVLLKDAIKLQEEPK